ncbi:MAG TPA: oligosaccharide flippase family protein [bacterium]|nr:oligosaccharide flippase family protein [bacterium]
MSSGKKLFTNTAIITLGTVLGSFLSYLYNMLMGRLLGPSQYGELTAIMSLIAVAGVGGGAITLVAMRYSSELWFKKHNQALKRLIAVLTRAVFLGSCVLFLLGVILSKSFQDLFSLTHYSSVIIAFSSLIFGLIIFVNRGVLQGTQRFVSISITGATENALRLALGVGLVLLGFGLNGALVAIVLATMITYFFTIIPLRRLLPKPEDLSEVKFSFDKKEIVAYSWPALLAALFLALSMNMDIFLVKHYFPADQAGVYAAVSTVAKIILYLTAPIISVMFPMISELQTKNEKHYKMLLYSLSFTLVAALAVLGVYSIAPGFVLRVLYGSSYTAYYYLLPQVGIMVVFFTLINLMSNYFMAVKHFVFLRLFPAIIILQVILVGLWHSSLSQVVSLLTFTLALLFMVMFGYYLFTKRIQLRAMIRGINE